MSDFGFQYRHGFRWIAGVFLVLVLAFGRVGVLRGQQSGVALVFSADPQVSDDFWPVLLQSVREDLDAGSGEVPEGVALDRNAVLLRREDLVRGIEAGSVIQVRLLDRCDVLPQADRPWRRTNTAPLGWVTRSAGEIQPFIFIDCERLAQVLGPATLGLNREQRRLAMAQAIAHVLIHEWIHVTTQSSSHSSRGIERASLSARELIASPPQARLRAANN